MKGLDEFQEAEIVGRGRTCRPEEQHKTNESAVVGIKGVGEKE